MDWLVKNAINRDVERQHLNKILQDIRAAINEIQSRLARDTTEEARIRAVVAQMLTSGTKSGINVTYNATSKAIDFAVNTFTIQLTGAVTGTATVTGLGNVSISTTLSEESDGVEEAPLDGLSYWRNMGTWVTVPFPLETLQFLTPGGILVLDEELNWYARTIEGVAGEIDVTDGDGIAGNPTVGLADVTPVLGGDLVKVEFDSKGRRVEEEPVTAADLTPLLDPYYDPIGSGDAALLAAMDYATALVDDLTPESLGMGVGYDQTTGSRLTDIDTMFGQPPTFFSCASTATGIPVTISGQGVYIPFSTTAGMQIYASSSVQDANRRLFYRAGSGSTWGNWIEFGFRYWNAASAASGNVSPNLDLNDAMIRTALAISPTINNPSGTKRNGRILIIRLRDNGTARAITWGSEYRAMGSLTLPTTTVINKTLYIEFVVNADEGTLDLMRVIQQP